MLKRVTEVIRAIEKLQRRHQHEVLIVQYTVEPVGASKLEQGGPAVTG